MKQFDLKRTLALLPALCLALSLAACGGSGGSGGAASATAASMWLVKTEGTVAVTDDGGADVSLTERLGLFSGYGVATQEASYGWIDLDATKLTKMDENSNITVQKDVKNLTLTVNSGSLFFNVTEPLAADETMEIRSATMVTAIRGTCGWVEVPDAEHMNVYILEGTVECTAGDVTESVTAGQAASLSTAEGEDSVTVKSFSVSMIPDYVETELLENDDMVLKIQETAGLYLKPEMNAYGVSVFEQRDRYRDFDHLTDQEKDLVTRAVQATEAQDIQTLQALMGPEAGEFFTHCGQYKVMLCVNPTNITSYIRPENGIGYAAAYYTFSANSSNVSGYGIGLAQCPCTDWQFNGNASTSYGMSGEGGSWNTLSGTGTMVNGLWQGRLDYQEGSEGAEGQESSFMNFYDYTDGIRKFTNSDEEVQDNILLNCEAAFGEDINSSWTMEKLIW